MNTRLITVVTTVLLLGTATGCGTVRHFLFGRGARCGAPVQPLLGQTLVPAPTAHAPCNTCGVEGYAGPGDCGCYGTAYGGTGIVGHSSLGSPLVGGGYVDGGYVDGGIINGGTINGGFSGDPRWDNFNNRYNARRYDSEGDLIIQEDPLPPNAIVNP